MNIDEFMQAYKEAWERRDPAMFCALFVADGEYHNTPFAVQRGHAQLAEYWRRVQLQEDVRVAYQVLASTPEGGIAHWHVTYQVASEELFRIWAKSTGTNLVARKPGDPLPRMVLDGVLQAELEGSCIGRLLESTSPTIRLSPRRRATAISFASIRRPMPMPCQASAITRANSQVYSSVSRA